MSSAASLARLENVGLIFQVSRELNCLPGTSGTRRFISKVSCELGHLHARLENVVFICTVLRVPGRLPGPSGKRRFEFQSVARARSAAFQDRLRKVVVIFKVSLSFWFFKALWCNRHVEDVNQACSSEVGSVEPAISDHMVSVDPRRRCSVPMRFAYLQDPELPVQPTCGGCRPSLFVRSRQYGTGDF